MNADNDEKGNVTEFPHPDRNKLMLLCDCGCETFNLIANGNMECAYCDKVVDEKSDRWIERMPVPTHASPVEDSDDFVRNSYLRTSTFARKKIAKNISHWSDTNQVAMMLGYNNDGRGHLWVDIETEEQREWVMRKLMSLHEYVSTKALLNGPSEVQYTPVEPDDAQQENTTQVEDASEQTGAPDTSEGGTGNTGDASGG